MEILLTMKDKFNYIVDFPTELKDWKYDIEKIALEEGLSFFDTIFEMVDWDSLYQIAGRGGFPERYPHWSFGQDYDHMSKQHSFGVMKISEMVINTDPCYAYLMTSNSLADQKMVIAHVYGHADFFLNNMWFSKTDRKMLDTMGNHSKIVNMYVDRYGEESVESFLDICLSIDSLVDKHSIFIQRKSTPVRKMASPLDEKIENIDDAIDIFDIDPEKQYMDEFINKKEDIEKLRKEARDDKKEEDERDKGLPEKDILLLLINRAPMKHWQRHILSLLREESYYFAPQAMTKIMNEGWASYWHEHIMTKRRILCDDELIEYAEQHAGTMGSSKQLNPYKLGLEIFKDIEDRWNKGKFGKEWEDCENLQELENWDKKVGKGREKIFDVRRTHNDVEFIDEFFTKELCEKLQLYNYDKRDLPGNIGKVYILTDREFAKIKQRLLFSLSNHGLPAITATETDFQGNGTLKLVHSTESDYVFEEGEAKEVVKNIQALWKKPVQLELTNKNGKYTYTNRGAQTTVSKSRIEPKPSDIYDTYEFE